jgi:hypothetical protein
MLVALSSTAQDALHFRGQWVAHQNGSLCGVTPAAQVTDSKTCNLQLPLLFHYMPVENVTLAGQTQGPG